MSHRERFTEFVTSGAFTMTLTRSQVAQLSMLAAGEDVYGCASLFRKGLADEAPRPDIAPDRVEYRITQPGLLVGALLRAAGLSNGEADPWVAENERLRVALSEARSLVALVRENAMAAFARKFNVEQENEKLQRRVASLEAELVLAQRGARLKDEFADAEAFVAHVPIRARDPKPGLTDQQLQEALNAGAQQ